MASSGCRFHLEPWVRPFGWPGGGNSGACSVSNGTGRPVVGGGRFRRSAAQELLLQAERLDLHIGVNGVVAHAAAVVVAGHGRFSSLACCECWPVSRGMSSH